MTSFKHGRKFANAFVMMAAVMSISACSGNYIISTNDGHMITTRVNPSEIKKPACSPIKMQTETYISCSSAMLKKWCKTLAYCCISSSAMAIGLNAEQGKNTSALDAEIGRSSGGLYLDSQWIKIRQMVCRLVRRVPVITRNRSGDADRWRESDLHRWQKGDNGVAFPVGGGEINLPADFAIYGEGYSAPEQLTNSVKNFVEANAGVSWSPLGPLVLKWATVTRVSTALRDLPPDNIVSGKYTSNSKYKTTDTDYSTSDANESQREILVKIACLKGWQQIERLFLHHLYAAQNADAGNALSNTKLHSSTSPTFYAMTSLQTLNEQRVIITVNNHFNGSRQAMILLNPYPSVKSMRIASDSADTAQNQHD
ncbi:hypothetical protein EVAR_101247_1 [Eumeta japonica]|uniref:Uncharacterized protein n=1 Tax=Eumeta variegata TaxID=151549 RepID=A0A4C1SQG4_EUMVA|nr:hypothetical protein EVAR_101247_1 [Eumeta japonica]